MKTKGLFFALPSGLGVNAVRVRKREKQRGYKPRKQGSKKAGRQGRCVLKEMRAVAVRTDAGLLVVHEKLPATAEIHTEYISIRKLKQ